MDSIQFVIILGALGFFLDIEKVNHLFDFIVPIYTVAVLVFIGLYIKYDEEDSSSNVPPVYKWNLAKEPAVPLPWRDQFEGTWILIGTRGEKFKEFLLMNGAPSFLAGTLANKPLTVTMTKEGGNLWTYDSSGFPSGKSRHQVAEESKEAAAQHSTENKKVDSPTKEFISHWFDEEEKTKTTLLIMPHKKFEHYTIRRIDEEGHLVMINKLYPNPNPNTGDPPLLEFEAKLKRKV